MVDVSPRPHLRASRRYIQKAPGVYMGRKEIVPWTVPARGAKVDHHRAVVVGDEDVGGFDIEVQHLCWHDAQAAQHFVEQRAYGGFAEDLLRL